MQTQDADAVRHVLEILYNEVMKPERQKHLGVAPHERSKDRQGHANGFKDRVLKNRMGSLDLKVPQTRGTDFYPATLEKGCRSERALKGVSTRKVAAITKKLCGIDVSSTQVSTMTKLLNEKFSGFRDRPLGELSYVYLDTTYRKVRSTGTVISAPVSVAYGVNKWGKREILGASTQLSEAEVHWRTFLE